MMSRDWSLVRLEDIQSSHAGAIAIGPFGSRMKRDHYTPTGISVIRGSNLGSTKSFVGDFVYVSPEFAATLGNCNVYDGDLVFPHRGNIGEVGIVTGGAKAHYVLSTSMMKITLNKTRADPLYLFYFFKSHQGKHELLKNASQVGTPGIATPLTSLRSVCVPLPPLPEQHAIAHSLDALNAKIELNQRINQTLEVLARAIFKSWFVDFDPVRARMNGEQPVGMDAKTAALFPSAFVESELGLIPEGWAIKSLDRIAHYQNGLALQNYPPESEEYLPVIKIRELRQGYSDDRSDKTSPNIKPECLVDDGDVIFSWSGSLLVDIWCGGKGALNQHLFKVTSVDYPRWFYYLWTRYHLSEFQHIAEGKVTTMGHIQRHHLTNALVVVPSDAVLQAADSIMNPLVEALVCNSLQSRTVAELRDTLLPKLISGQIRVLAPPPPPDPKGFLKPLGSDLEEKNVQPNGS